MKRRFFGITLLAGIAIVGCTVQDRPPYPPVPAPMAETLPPPPVTSTQLIWQPGHWEWTGTGYAWQPGQYVAAEGHSNLWVQGYWANTPSGWLWQPAHWQ